MPYSFQCVCGRRVRASRKHAGRRGECPHCGQTVIIPTRGGGMAEPCEDGAHPLRSSDELDALLAQYPLHPHDVEPIRHALMETYHIPPA